MIKKIVLMALLLVVFVSGCIRLPKVPAVESEKLTGEQIKTIASLKRIDDFPLYSMNYHGDYSEIESVNTELVKNLSDNSSQCTSIASHGDTPLFGRNHDYTRDPVMILFTRPLKGYASVSMVDLSYIGIDGRKDLSSIEEKSLLLYAPFVPCDGMNEKGLAIGLMARDDQLSLWEVLTGKSIVANRDGESLTSGLMIIRKVLDNASDVDQAIDVFRKHRIFFFASVRLHYLISDIHGKSAVIDYENGEMKVTRNSKAWQVSTNHGIFNSEDATRNRSIEYREKDEFRKSNDPDSYWRYITADHMLEQKKGDINVGDAMKIMERVSMEFSTTFSKRITDWSVVYDLKKRRADVVVGRKYNSPYTFKL